MRLSEVRQKLPADLFNIVTEYYYPDYKEVYKQCIFQLNKVFSDENIIRGDELELSSYWQTLLWFTRREHGRTAWLNELNETNLPLTPGRKPPRRIVKKVR